ncbi:cell wall-binding repeat-containing protein [Candidatus Poriferisodalis sp.]|uniref:cell wall-binding repeat-containing protein n=1 Tax=Candidatus Poriferisodalis sp. TaxID=3101277 RepID=UPI003B01A3A4
MTIYSKRQGRRSLAAILAAMLVASVLAVVAGAPAQAANSSSEALFDHDNDAGTAMVREFGGRDRYDTALRLANNFGRSKGLGAVPVAFVASGVSLVDAVSVAGLAGFLDAPILLTPGDSLNGGVADFIEDYGVGTIHILGGTGAVSDTVAEDIESLANEPTVSRIAGVDRYDTAAQAASRLGGGAAWCGSEDPAAILANGGDVSLVDVMMVGPIAHRLQLPMLLTASDELPSFTADFIEAEDIEHVVIVGNTDAVSADVEDALRDSGVDAVDRIGGDSAGATSVALAELLTGDCKDNLAPSSEDTVALVSMDGLPDGVAAAPVLSSTYAGGELVPVLIVGDTLPASIRDYLAATPDSVGGSKLNLKILAVGGTGAVSDSVMQAALEAAASADALTVQIAHGGTTETSSGAGDAVDPTDQNGDGKVDGNDAPQVGDTRIDLYFSDIIAGVGADPAAQTEDLTNKMRDILEINGAPAPIQGNVARNTAGSLDQCDPSKVTVNLSRALRNGDTISIMGGAKLGANMDQRPVGDASVTVTAKPPDRTRPSVSVVSIAGQGTAWVTITDNGMPLATTLAAENVTVKLGTAEARALVAAELTTGNIVLANETFAAGDRITIAASAVMDAAGNTSLQRSYTTIAAQKSPRITAVTMSSLNHSTNASAVVPVAITNGDGFLPFGSDGARNTADLRPDMWLKAKADGAAAGAAGNNWNFTFDRASTYDAAMDRDIDVRVNSRDQSVFVRFNNGTATFADLKAALEGNSAFDALFEVVIDPVVNQALNEGGCGMPANDNPLTIARGTGTVGEAGEGIERGVTSQGLGMGETKVAVEVRFNGYVESVSDEVLLADVLRNTLERVVAAGLDLSGGSGVPMVADYDDPAEYADLRNELDLEQTRLDAGADADPGPSKSFSAPSTSVRYELTAGNPLLLPQVRDLVTTAAGAEAGVDPVTDAVAAAALGYAEAMNNDEKNASSQLRITRSSAVTAPK